MNLKHRTIPHTDNNYERIVININYIKEVKNQLLQVKLLYPKMDLYILKKDISQMNILEIFLIY